MDPTVHRNVNDFVTVAYKAPIKKYTLFNVKYYLKEHAIVCYNLIKNQSMQDKTLFSLET